ncbi:hypothetical protein RB195_012751 [Necator americanus]|uniref:Ras association domain protein n=2 Tax=Necator americanus TaxID=51031 RepID=A0ABR1DSL6_NECAM
MVLSDFLRFFFLLGFHLCFPCFHVNPHVVMLKLYIEGDNGRIRHWQYQPSYQYLFVPPALSSLNLKPDDCQLVANYDKSANQTRFTFSVSWANENNEENTFDGDDSRLVLSIRAPVDEDSKFLSDVQQSKRKVSRAEKILCDGPCGRKYPPEEMNLLGRCAHYLCNVCYGLVYNDDGTKGCSNFGCVYATLYDYLPEDYARKAYENHIIARQRARESARFNENYPSNQSRQSSQSYGTSLDQRSLLSSDRASYRFKQEIPSAQAEKLQSRSPRKRGSLRARRRSSSSNLKGARRNYNVAEISSVPPKDDSSCQLPESTYAQSSSTESLNRRNRVLDEIFSDLTLTSTNLEGPTSEFELLNIRLMIFEPGPFKTIKRVHMSREMSAALTLKEAIDELLERRNRKIQHECPSRLYFCSGNTSEGLREITVDEFTRARLWQYPARNSVLHFVLDIAGYLKGTD